MFTKKIHLIIDEFRGGRSKSELIEKYGDFGLVVLNKYLKQDFEHPFFMSLNYETFILEIDAKKIEINKKYMNGISEKDIKKEYGDYGIFYLEKIKEQLKVPLL
jgi:hypothetical protein